MRLISALRDCKQRSLTVSKKALTVSKKASPKTHSKAKNQTSKDALCSARKGKYKCTPLLPLWSWEPATGPRNPKKSKVAQSWLKSDFQGTPLKLQVAPKWPQKWLLSYLRGVPWKSLFSRFWATLSSSGFGNMQQVLTITILPKEISNVSFGKFIGLQQNFSMLVVDTKTLDWVPSKVPGKQPKKQLEKPRQLFFGCFGCFLAVFLGFSRHFAQSPIGTFFGCVPAVFMVGRSAPL